MPYIVFNPVFTSTPEAYAGLDLVTLEVAEPVCPCELFTTSAFEAPMGKTKKIGSVIPVKFQLFFGADEVTSQEQLDQILEDNGCEAACPEIRIYDVTATSEGVELPDDPDDNPGEGGDLGICFRFSSGRWVTLFEAERTYQVKVAIGDCELTIDTIGFRPSNRRESRTARVDFTHRPRRRENLAGGLGVFGAEWNRSEIPVASTLISRIAHQTTDYRIGRGWSRLIATPAWKHTMTRYVIAAFGGGLLAYWLYWCATAYCFRSKPAWRGIVSSPLQSGRSGYLRLYVGWLIALAVYGFIATDEAAPFTWAWWYNAFFDGDWIVVLVAPLFLAYPFWRRAQGRTQIV